MPQLALPSSSALRFAGLAPWAHDIRNTLTTVGLHLETLERLSGGKGRAAAHAAHALMSRAAAMCTAAIVQDVRDEPDAPPGFDVMKTIVQIANLLRSIAPKA